MLMRLLVPAAMLASIFSGVDAARGETSAEIPFEAALKDADVALSSMASGQSESLILGNGDLYGIVWQKDGGLYMRVTKNDIWDARVDTSGDPPLPKVDIRNNTVSGAVHAPRSYSHLYPQPRCAAALRLGPTKPTGGVRWTCIRGAAKHQFESEAGRASATMQVAGAAGASTGYRATLSSAIEASALHLKITGSANALYYVNVYDKDGKNMLASGWKKSPTTAEEVELEFASQAIGQVEVYTQTSDGKTAENQLDALYLLGDDRKKQIQFPTAASVQAVLDLRHAVATINRSEQSATKIRVLADRNVVLIQAPEPVVLEPISAETLPDAEIGETDGIAGLITEFLMQSVDDTIRVFPCWPEDQDAAFTDLRAQGGFLVSAEYTNRQVQYVTVNSTVDGRLRVLSPWKTIYVNGKETSTGPDAVVQLQAKANEIFRFTPGRH